ncbi:MAG: hypothetical protein ABH834_00860 [Candidatus Altiarchaeota archaeon]
MNRFLFCVVFLLAASGVASGLDEFKLLWEHPLIKGADEVQVVDVGGDGVPEIYAVSYSTKNAMLSCFSSNGSLLWDAGVPRFSLSGYPTEEVRIVRVVDVDGDEYADLIIGSEAIAPSVNYHPLYLAERAPEKGVGVVRVQRKWTYDKSGLTTSAVVSDFYGNDTLYVVSSSTDFSVYLISLDGDVSGVFDLGSSVRDVYVFNADGDVGKEFIVGVFEGMAFFDNGTFVWQHPSEHRILKVLAYDLDSDGVSEFIGASSSRIYVLSPEGKLIWDSKIDDLTSNLLVADLESDGRPEILFGSGGKLTILDFNGSLLGDVVLDGRVNGVALVDPDGDGVSDVVVGLNSRIAVLELSAIQVKADIALNHHKKALEYYGVGEIKKAVSELEEAIRVYSEIERFGEAGELRILLAEYERNLVLEDKIKLAFTHMHNARLFFSAGKYVNATQTAQKALAIFESVNNSEGVAEAKSIVSLVEEHDRASLLTAEAEQLYVSGDFDEAMVKAREAFDISTRLNDSLGVKKAASVISLVEDSLSRLTTYPLTTTLIKIPPRYTTTLKSPGERQQDKYLVYVGAVMVALMFIYVLKTGVSRKGGKPA